MRIRRPIWQDDDAPISCRQLAPVLQAFIDGEAHQLDEETIRDHLQACRDCGLEHDTYLAIKKSVAQKAVPVPDAVRARLVAFADELGKLADHDRD